MNYVQLGQDLFDFVSGIDISSVEPTGWAQQLNRPFKADEKPTYPAIDVAPLRDEMESEDSRTDDKSITYAVRIYVSFFEGSVAESDIRQLVDLVHAAFQAERATPQTFGSSYDFSFRGGWGGDETQAERFYQLEVTARAVQDY